MSSVALANISKVNSPWHLENTHDGVVNMSSEDRQIDFYVYSQTQDKKGKWYRSDTVTFDCNGIITKVKADSHTTCEVKALGYISYSIESKDFHHGSSGYVN
jgi:hypothetical protein